MIKSFPVLQIKDKNPASWKEVFWEVFGKNYDFVEPEEVPEEKDLDF